MKTKVATIILLSGVISACPWLPSSNASLSGRVHFPAARQVLAVPQEVGASATVSLIDPNTSQTIATTLSQSDGTFSLSIPTFQPSVKTYYLEALKGLHANTAGHDAARLRTLVRWNGNAWSALTVGDASIGYSTTALSAIVGLRAAHTPVDPSKLIGTLTLNPDTFSAGGTGITQAEFDSVKILVEQALVANRDPLEAVLYDGAYYQLKVNPETPSQPYIDTVTPNPATGGAVLRLRGGNFQSAIANNILTYNGTPLAISSAATDLLVASLPENAVSGLLSVRTFEGEATASLAVISAVDGSVLPSPAPSLTPTTPGSLEIPGTVFGR